MLRTFTAMQDWCILFLTVGSIILTTNLVYVTTRLASTYANLSPHLVHSNVTDVLFVPY